MNAWQGTQPLIDEFETSYTQANFEGWGWEGAHSWQRQRLTTAVCVTATHAQTARTVPRLLHSLVAQTLPPTEIWLLVYGVGASSGRNAACSDAFAKLRAAFPGPSLHLLCASSKSASAQEASSRHQLARKVSSDLVAFVSADDVLLPRRLASVAAAFQRGPSLQVVLHRKHMGTLAPFEDPATDADTPGPCQPMDVWSEEKEALVRLSMPTVRASALRPSLGLRFRHASFNTSSRHVSTLPTVPGLDVSLARDAAAKLRDGAAKLGSIRSACVLDERLAMVRPSVVPTRTLAMRLVGGLGNRMFQLQGLLGVAAASESTPMVNEADLSLLREVFEVDMTRLTTTDARIESLPLHRHRMRERSLYDFTRFDLSKCAHVGGCQLEGYLQSLQYLDALAPLGLRGPEELSKLWRIKEEHLVAAKQLFESVGRQSGGARSVEAWVGVHVRRFPEQHPDGTPSAANLRAALRTAVGELEDRHTYACVMVFSNDPMWALGFLRDHDRVDGGTIHSSNGHRPLQCIHAAPNEWRKDPMLPSNDTLRGEAWATQTGRDLAALTQLCDRLVLTSGTFGVIAGLLHGGRRGPVWAWAHAGTQRLHQPHWRIYGRNS